MFRLFTTILGEAIYILGLLTIGIIIGVALNELF